MKKLLKKSVILIIAIAFSCLLSPRFSFAQSLSDMTLGDSVSINDRMALVDGVALGDGFALVDGGEGIKVWDMITFRPMFRLQQQYDSNIFLDPNDEKDDWITSFDAGAEAEMKMGDVLLKGGYVFNMNLFMDHNDQNSYNHTAIGKIDWKLTDYEVIISNKYRRFSSRAGAEDTARVSRRKNVLSADVLSGFNKLSFDMGYDFIIEDYLSDEFVSGAVTYDEGEDRMEHIFREEVSYRFLPKTSVLGEVDFGIIDYDTGLNS
ncbi:MAG: outer membrane beta-barrel protein, partial [Candidatus Omnitrophota bacterium]|nr:outer membrane beta-barrel protein [Candidatus Omnitrophota bacterium]